MVNRKKRLRKGVESTLKEIEKHKQKRDDASEEGDEELAKYHDKEIKGMEDQVKKKEDILNK